MVVIQYSRNFPSLPVESFFFPSFNSGVSSSSLQHQCKDHHALRIELFNRSTHYIEHEAFFKDPMNGF